LSTTSAATTWTRGNKRTKPAHFGRDGSLADEFPDIQVWMLRYGAPKFRFQSRAITLPDLATSVLSHLIDKELGRRDLLFVTHGFGGLVVKELLAISKMNAGGRLEIIAALTRGIVFLATPHTGLELAKMASHLGIASMLAGFNLTIHYCATSTIGIATAHRHSVGRRAFSMQRDG
jgi:hypothetical protein